MMSHSYNTENGNTMFTYQNMNEQKKIHKQKKLMYQCIKVMNGQILNYPRHSRYKVLTKKLGNNNEMLCVSALHLQEVMVLYTKLFHEADAGLFFKW